MPDSVEIARVSDDQYGPVDQTLPRFIQNQLAWVMTWHTASCPVLGPINPGPSLGAPSSVTCEQVIFVDAKTGNYLTMYQGAAAR